MERNKALGTYSQLGKKIYNGTSLAPTVGRADPTGYVERKVRNNAKGAAMRQWLKDHRAGAHASAASLRLGPKGK